MSAGFSCKVVHDKEIMEAVIAHSATTKTHSDFNTQSMAVTTTQHHTPIVTCAHCYFPGSEVQFSCGCTLHSRCVPVPLVAIPGGEGELSRFAGGMDNVGSGLSQHNRHTRQQHILPRLPHTMVCPFCCSNSNIHRFEILSMGIDLLDRAVESKRKLAIELLKTRSSTSSDQIHNNNSNTGAFVVQHSPTGEESLNEIQAESTYLLVNHTATLLSNGGGGGGSGNTTTDCYRTGRWTDEEIEYVDCLIDAYDRGVLPLPVGVRLNDFLCSLLLCKASRLTKKMKNAKLSVRSYELDPHDTIVPLDVKTLSKLQEKFLLSIVDEHARLELQFNMEKSWRTNLSNLCVQVGSTLCNATAWFDSLESMERRATSAYENIRRARRHQMGLALKTDVGASNGVFFSDMPVQHTSSSRRSRGATKKKSRDKVKTQKDSGSIGESIGSHDEESNRSGGTHRHISNMLDIGETYDNSNKDTIDDFAGIFNDLLNDIPSNISSKGMLHSRECGSFLDEVLAYVEERDLPFTHFDVWVPSFVPQAASGTSTAVESKHLRLYHAGHCTRSDINPLTYSQLHEYGEYSTKFSFAPGVGLPGRVFQNGKPSWERHIDEADPRIFERAGGAKVYGIKTGVGIPVDVNSTVRRIIVALYSQSDVAMNNELLNQLSSDLQMFCPKPKWKLVVEMGSSTIDENDTSDNHYHHGTSPNFESALDPLRQATAMSIAVPQHYAVMEQSVKQDAAMPEVTRYNPGASVSNNNSNQQKHHHHRQPISPISNQAAVEVPSPNMAVDIAHYHHGSSPRVGNESSNPFRDTVAWKQSSFSIVARNRSSSVTSIQSESIDSETKRDVEIGIAALLGDHMPSVEREPSSDGTLLPHFMSLRLMLLRLPERRTEEENSLLDIIKRSYRCFSRDGNRASKEIGNLLARDWQYLQSTLHPTPPVSVSFVPPESNHPTTIRRGSAHSEPSAHTLSSVLSHQHYQSFVLNPPPLSTHSTTGVPITMPPLRLGYTDNNTNEMILPISSNNNTPSFESEGMIKKQRME